MDVMYISSRHSQCHMNHDGFCIVDDRSRISFSTKYRSASYPETASSLYHSFLLVICRVGHVHDATNQRSLPGIGDQIETLQGAEKAKNTSNELSALSDARTVRGRSVSYDGGTRYSDKVPENRIHQSRLDAIKYQFESVGPGDAANTHLQPRILGDNSKAIQRKLLKGPVKERQSFEHPQEQQKASPYLSKNNNYAADLPLPPSNNPILLVDSPSGKYATAAIAGRSEKREREDSDDDITEIPIKRKKAKKRTLKVTVSVKAHGANGKFSASPGALGGHRAVFDITRWLDFDWQSLAFNSFNNALQPHSGVQASLAVANADSTGVRSASLSPIFNIKQVSSEPHVDAGSFVSAIQKFNELVESCDASARFAQDAGHCLANNRYGARCMSRHGIPIEDQPIVGKLLAELRRLNFDSSPSSCVNKLLAFTNLAVCPYQRVEIRKRVAGLPQRNVEQPDAKGLVKYLPQILPYRPPGSANLTVNEFVMQQAVEPFDVSRYPEWELGEGYLYVFWNEATFGVRKIGFTTKEVGDRLKDWETGCRRTAKEEYRSPRKVLHAAKIEQLVHADLLKYRVREPACRICLKSHIEWFRGVDLPFIIGRIEVWSQWISERPYQKVGRKWCLTNWGRDRMPLLD